MVNEIISYLEMCQRENASLQRGMNYHIGGASYSVILMSVRKNAPYQDRIENNGAILIYEGHNAPKNHTNIDPKHLDQPEYTPNGTLTPNGKFHHAAQSYKHGKQQAEIVRVYEKIKQGIWSYNGQFKLVDSWVEYDGIRQVYKFKLEILDEEVTISRSKSERVTEPSRVIPTSVKLEVWKRDSGKCVQCGATDNLHFDHIIPYSKGGTSLKAENIQLLCARHNLEKRDKII